MLIGRFRDTGVWCNLYEGYIQSAQCITEDVGFIARHIDDREVDTVTEQCRFQTIRHIAGKGNTLQAIAVREDILPHGKKRTRERYVLQVHTSVQSIVIHADHRPCSTSVLERLGHYDTGHLRIVIFLSIQCCGIVGTIESKVQAIKSIARINGRYRHIRCYIRDIPAPTGKRIAEQFSRSRRYGGGPLRYRLCFED